MKRIIEINIDEIVLQGLETMDAETVSRSVEAGLMRLIGEQGLQHFHSQHMNIDHIQAGSIRYDRSSRVENIGHAIAGSVFQGITNQRKPSGK